jgi:hypothetical protein
VRVIGHLRHPFDGRSTVVDVGNPECMKKFIVRPDRRPLSAQMPAPSGGEPIIHRKAPPPQSL